ncbi:MAG: hypothetical protein H6815_08650 [Phycisphaeraceae bacterium]|nr:hypothetical protein [Phycisphaerales bacterium]MCB9860511.1 hypothetical protein [Phycisphaeraceae bacterium]
MKYTTPCVAALLICQCATAQFAPDAPAYRDPIAIGENSDGTLMMGDKLPKDVEARALETINKAMAFLRTKQDEATGGWGINPNGPNFPAITALVITGMSMSPNIDGFDPSVSRGIDYILSTHQPDGGFYDKILPQYNTSICLSALARFKQPRIDELISPAQQFIRTLQYWEGADGNAAMGEVSAVARDHPFYGGVGYGRHGRPDLSNLGFAIQAMHDSGIPADDPFMQRAIVFLQRVQMNDTTNDQPYADGSSQGGFIYATAENQETIGLGQSQAGTIEESLSDGTVESKLRCYGSMTYAGFKSYLYADLARDDPRVIAAHNWVCKNYTMKENPGIGTEGQYYYYTMLARALHAYGQPMLDVADDEGFATRVDWRVDLINQLASMQEADGSFKVVDDRWMENDPVLITSYSLIALQHALGRD